MASQDPQSIQNEVQTNTKNHEIQENIKKVKSHENTAIYNTSEGLGHQKSADFLFKSHQKSRLQSKHDN